MWDGGLLRDQPTEHEACGTLPQCSFPEEDSKKSCGQPGQPSENPKKPTRIPEKNTQRPWQKPASRHISSRICRLWRQAAPWACGDASAGVKTLRLPRWPRVPVLTLVAQAVFLLAEPISTSHEVDAPKGGKQVTTPGSLH